ncbi:MAG: hypothetical protein ABIN01_09130 [Ferruginibacter sp.]
MDKEATNNGLGTYRDALLSMAWYLDEVKSQLFENICEVTMTGELREWTEKMPRGETETISDDLLKACDDLNGQRLLKLVRTIDANHLSFVNINAIADEEMEEFKKHNTYSTNNDDEDGVE